MNYMIENDWKPGTKYRVSVDSASVYTIYGLFNAPVSHEFTTREAEEYSTLIFNIKGAPDTASVVVQLLSTSDVPVRSVPAEAGVARIDYVLPGTYYARAFIDNDGDGEWTTGNMLDHRLPEDVYYFPKKINLKKNWDITNDWDLNELPVDMQKPNAIKKNKPKTRESNRNDDEEEDEDEYMYDDMGRPGYDNRNPFDNQRTGRNGNRSGGNAQLRQGAGAVRR